MNSNIIITDFNYTQLKFNKLNLYEDIILYHSDILKKKDVQIPLMYLFDAIEEDCKMNKELFIIKVEELDNNDEVMVKIWTKPATNSRYSKIIASYTYQDIIDKMNEYSGNQSCIECALTNLDKKNNNITLVNMESDIGVCIKIISYVISFLIFVFKLLVKCIIRILIFKICIFTLSFVIFGNWLYIPEYTLNYTMTHSLFMHLFPIETNLDILV